jgi:predicted DsbA family dithiol-disulfide isomerase
MKVEIWSDLVCPWCYVGKHRFEAALARFEGRDEVEVVWRAFELDPAAPTEHRGDYAARLARKYGVALDEARTMIETMTRVGAESGIGFRFDIARPGNTLDAHRLVQWAADGGEGRQGDLVQRLFAATFNEGRPIGDHATLAAVAAEAGLDSDGAWAVLGSDRYAFAVRGDEREARALGIHAVPFFVIDRAYGLAGAHPPGAILGALQEAARAPTATT